MSYVDTLRGRLSEAQADNMRLREAINEAMTSLATGTLKDGWAYSVLERAIAPDADAGEEDEEVCPSCGVDMLLHEDSDDGPCTVCPEMDGDHVDASVGEDAS